MLLNKVFLMLMSSNFVSNSTIIINYLKHQNLILKEEKPVVDFSDTFTKAYEFKEGLKQYYGWKIDSFGSVTISNQKITNPKATTIGEPIIVFEDKKYNFIGEDVLKNYNHQEQVMKTVEFEKTIESQYRASVTAGVSLESDANFIFFDAKIKVSLSGTIEEVERNSEKFTIPSQEIKVPPSSQIIAKAYWSQVQMKQKVSIRADISGTVSGTCNVTNLETGNKAVWNDTFPLGQTLYSYFQGYKTYWPDCPKSITVNNDDSIHFEGALDCWGTGAGSYHEVDVGPSTPIEN